MAQPTKLRHFFANLFAFRLLPALGINLENKLPDRPGPITSMKYLRHCIADAGDA